MSNTANARVLIIDDNVAIHDDFRKILCPAPSDSASIGELEALLFDAAPPPSLRATFRIDSAYQGQEGIDAVGRAVAAGDPYTVVFVDVRTPPGLDGIQTLVGIWQRDPRVQAVICSAYSDQTWEDMVRALGHSDGMLVLRKPFDAIEVMQIAHALSRKWELSREVERRLAQLESTVDRRTRELAQTNGLLQREIAQRREAQTKLQRIATHDSLTGLPNRLLLSDRLTHAIERTRRNQKPLALMLLDLDRFKDVNDSFGHAAGDQLLQITARRLRETMRDVDTVARLGGDEFVILVEDLAEPADAAIVAKRVLAACSAPVELAGQLIRTPPSIGVAVYPHDSRDAEGLLKSADLAMYQAKRSGRGYAFFAPDMVTTVVARMELRAQLEEALAQGELKVWYQPLFDVATGAITTMEALVRWQHPTSGLVSPIRFIPEAEQSGQIVPIGAWVMRQACAQLATWRRRGRELTVAVNVSARQLHDPGFLDLVTECLAAHDLPPGSLELEITESAAVLDFEGAASVLSEVARLGVAVVVDDFGAGYSSLMRLHEMPIKALKIDRFFIHDVSEDPRNAAIVVAIIAMANSLGIKVVAEGVERLEQLEFLRSMGTGLDRRPVCDRVQGFLLGSPLPAEAATQMLFHRDAGRPILGLPRRAAGAAHHAGGEHAGQTAGGNGAAPTP